MDQSAFHYKLARRLRSLPAQIASRAINLPIIDARLTTTYERARALHAATLPALPPDDAAIVQGLEEKGVHITSLEALGLPASGDMWNSAKALYAIFARRAANGEYAHQYTVQAEADELISRPEIISWGLNARILRIVEAYIGLPLSYDMLNMFYTVADGREVAARRWHRDVEDRRMVKVIVYLNDVDVDSGPLEILHRAFPGSRTLAGSNFPVLTQDMLAEKMGKPLEEGDVTTCTGSAGTVIFADVASHYHRGRPAKRYDRCALFYNYFSRSPLRPFFCGRHVLSPTQLEEFARGLSAGEREYLLWRDSLPLFARLVPRAPL